MIAGARCETTINVAECLALRDALWIARSKGFWKILVKGDSKLVIDAVQGTSSVPWRVMNIIEDIKNIARSLEYISWAHVFREANFVVDAITSRILINFIIILFCHYHVKVKIVITFSLQKISC